jgi:hypothetical protein
MERRDVIAEGVLSTKMLLARYLKGFGDGSHTAQAAGLPNHVAWNLGHLARTMHRVAQEIDGGEAVPAADFIDGSAVNTLEKFGTETVCFGSPPPEGGTVWPRFERCVQVYENAVDRLAVALRGAEEAKLDTTMQWGAAQMPLWLIGLRMVFHNGMHTGEIADLRRGLGMGSIFG